MNLDITQYLKDTENSLRDLISTLLKEKTGAGWIKSCGVTGERIEKWEERKQIETKRQKGGTAEERLLYYADFYDIRTILQKNWELFSAVFGDWKKMDIFLSILEVSRDPDAHRRELLPHQKYLIAGISGEIRTMITKFRSKKETSEDCFPRFESARDNLGNMCTPENKHLKTKLILRPGDQLDFIITASDPEDAQLEYRLMITGGGTEIFDWQKDNNFNLKIKKRHISKRFGVTFFLRSSRDYHAGEDFDDIVSFEYAVLPEN